MSKLYQAIVVTRIVVECETEAEAYSVIEQAARCAGAVGDHFSVKSHSPEIKMVAPVGEVPRG